MGQRSNARTAVQGAVPADIAADLRPTALRSTSRPAGSEALARPTPRNSCARSARKCSTLLRRTPDRLREVDGIGPVRANRITAAWAEQKAVREIMVFLHSHGVGTARAVRIYKTYGPDAIQVMTENLYRLARDIRGIGFKTADAIAMKLGIEKTALVRVRAGISYALTEAMDEGHCGLPTEELIPLAEKLLEVPQELIRTALDLELQQGTVIADRVGETPCVFLAGLHRAERTIAERLTRLANGKLPWPWIDPAKALPWVEGRIGVALAESQVTAIRLALMSKVLVKTGGPGVGKTTIVNAILRILAAKGIDLLLCSIWGPTCRRLGRPAHQIGANGGRMLGVITAIRVLRMQKDQSRVGHTIHPSDSGRQASERPLCCHKESAAAYL